MSMFAGEEGRSSMSTSTPLRILVVEDDASIRRFITGALEEAGHLPEEAAQGTQGLEKASERPYDAAIVDLMLPDIDGFQVVRMLRERRLADAILVLSARDAVGDRVQGLTLGADDYLGKPFDIDELLARVDAVTRRTAHGGEFERYEAGGVVLDLATREVHREGRKIELTRREMSLLAQLMKTPGRPVSKSVLLRTLWHANFDPATNVVDVLVCRLRGKLDKDFPARLIHTMRGVGYVFRAAPQ